MKKRNVNIDLVKCIAVFSVISVHFFANTGFYNKIISGSNMYIAVFFRTLFMICVPLFLITTGYLMKNKKLSKRYYLGLSMVLIVYVIVAMMYLGYHAFYTKDNYFTLKHIISSILGFNIANSWYIEMYIGLFLLIPFLNLIYNNLENKRQKNVLLLTMLITTSFQGIFNIKYNIMPNWWQNIFPITYYFIGCYLNEYKINIKKINNILFILFSIIVNSLINICISYNNIFVRDLFNDWGSILNVVMATLTFIFFINLNLDEINKKYKRIIIKISELSFGIYLTSGIIDNFIYFQVFPELAFCNIKNYFIMVPLVFILSTSLSMIINFIYKIIDKKIILIIKNKVIEKT